MVALFGFSLFGAHEIQRFNRDADETITWIAEKDNMLSTDDYGSDLASVQTLQRKHEGVERDLAALEEKVRRPQLRMSINHCFCVAYTFLKL